MKQLILISCDNCAVVLDKDKLGFPSRADIWNEDLGRFDESISSWSTSEKEYVPMCLCPVCGSEILDD
jgi:hypothetical protein